MNHTYKVEKQLPDRGNCVILSIWENHRAKGGFTPLIFRRVQSSPPDERKEGETMYVTFLASIIIAVMAGVVSHRINKWLDSKDTEDNQ